jgi:dienelactone hydrolase
MGELQILEGLIGFLIVLPLLRPFFIKLEGLDGLLFLPLLSFGITFAIFPAYGFRPECIFLLGYTFFLAVVYLPPVLALLGMIPPVRVLKRRPFFDLIVVILLVPITAIALSFAPSQDTGLVTDGVYIRKVENSTEKTEFALRIYGPGENSPPNSARRPLMLIVPPIAGSVAVTDQVCRELRDRGFTVISYSRLRFDTPQYGEDGKKKGTSLAAVYRLFRIHTQGFKSLPVNTDGRTLEAERIKDVNFLLTYIQEGSRKDSAFSGIDTGHIFIAGYGAGGGALIRAAGSPGFIRAYPGVKAIISIEGPVFSAFVGEPPPASQAAGGDGSWVRALWAGITRWFSRWRVQKITGVGEIPRPQVPALYMVSDKALVPRHRDGRYAAVFRALEGSREPAVLAAIPGAGPLDYSDIPEKFPIYRILFPGRKQRLWETRNFTRETAGLITNFAALFLDDSPAVPSRVLPGVVPQVVPQVILRRENLAKDIYLEAGGVWNFRNPGDILEL